MPKKIKQPHIVICISGGAVQSVKKPRGVSVEIRDYDIDNGDCEPWNNPNCEQDDDNDWYQRMFWAKNEGSW